MKSKIVIFVLLLAALLVSACGTASGELEIQNAWARPTSTGENGAAYFMIANGTSVTDTLLSVSSDIATAAEVHMSMADANGVMSMQMQEAVTIPAGEQVEFKPGGLHVMFVNLTRDLKPGEAITLTLNFKETGNVVVEVPVKAP